MQTRHQAATQKDSSTGQGGKYAAAKVLSQVYIIIWPTGCHCVTRLSQVHEVRTHEGTIRHQASTCTMMCVSTVQTVADVKSLQVEPTK